MTTDQVSQKATARKRKPLLACGCLLFFAIIFLAVILPNIVPNVLAGFQARQAADSYLNSVKAEKHIRAWEFSGPTISFWTGDGLSGGDKADFTGTVSYEDGQRASLNMTWRNDSFMNYLHENWRLDKFELGPDSTLTPTP